MRHLTHFFGFLCQPGVRLPYLSFKKSTQTSSPVTHGRNISSSRNQFPDHPNFGHVPAFGSHGPGAPISLTIDYTVQAVSPSGVSSLGGGQVRLISGDSAPIQSGREWGGGRQAESRCITSTQHMSEGPWKLVNVTEGALCSRWWIQSGFCFLAPWCHRLARSQGPLIPPHLAPPLPSI